MLCFAAQALTTFTYISRFNDGTTNMNPFVLSAYPPASPFTTDGTNTFFGAMPETNTPTASGWLTNSISAGLYTLTYPAFPQYGVFVNVANTTATNNLSLYYTNVPVVPTFAGYILNSYAGVSNAVGFVIATNGGAISYTQLPFTPPTNTMAGLNYVYGLPPTSVPATNTDPRITLAVTNLSSVGVAASAPGWLTTNGFTVWLSLKTNGVPGAAWTNLPQGSICMTTNGQPFVLSNLVWRSF